MNNTCSFVYFNGDLFFALSSSSLPLSYNAGSSFFCFVFEIPKHLWILLFRHVDFFSLQIFLRPFQCQCGGFFFNFYFFFFFFTSVYFWFMIFNNSINLLHCVVSSCCCRFFFRFFSNSKIIFRSWFFSLTCLYKTRIDPKITNS